MKKFLSSVLCILLVVTAVSGACISVSAQTGNNIYSDEITATAGGSIRVPIYISENTGVMGWKLEFEYDPEYLTPTTVDYGDVITSGINDNIEGDATLGNINVYWAGVDEEYYNGVMIYINFNVASTAVGTSEIKIGYSQEDTFDGYFDDVIFNCNNINVTFVNGTYDNSPKLSVAAGDIVAGGEVTAEITLKDVGELTSADISVSFDKDNFSFVSVSALAGVSANASSENGVVTIKTSGITSLTEGAQILSLKFKSDDYAYSGKYDFSVSASNFVGAENILGAACTISVSPSDSSNSAIIYSDEGLTSEKDETISVPVKIAHNKGIMGYKIHIKFNADYLSPVSVTKGSEFAGSIYDSIGNTAGEFDILWNHYENVAVDGVLASVKVKVLTDISTDTEIEVSYSQVDTFNESWDDVVFDCRNINIKLNPDVKYSVNIDGVKNAEIEDGSQYSLPKSLKNGFVAYKCGQNYYDEGDKITVTANTDITTITLDVNMLSGASMRLKSESGIRFYTSIDLEKLQSLNEMGASISMGTLIAPENLLDGNELTFEAGVRTSENPSGACVDVKYTANRFFVEKEFEGMVGSIVNIKTGNANRRFIGRGYVTVTLGGVTNTVYAEYADGSISNNTRTVAQLSYLLKNASNDDYTSLSEIYKKIINDWVALYDINNEK